MLETYLPGILIFLVIFLVFYVVVGEISAGLGALFRHLHGESLEDGEVAVRQAQAVC